MVDRLEDLLIALGSLARLVADREWVERSGLRLKIRDSRNVLSRVRRLVAVPRRVRPLYAPHWGEGQNNETDENKNREPEQSTHRITSLPRRTT